MLQKDECEERKGDCLEYQLLVFPLNRSLTHQPLSKRIGFIESRQFHTMSITLHTTEGDLELHLHIEACPKASFNFLALCASQYFDNSVFHRNVPGALIQGGDPTGTGKGGESIFSAFRAAKQVVTEDATNTDDAADKEVVGVAGASQHGDDSTGPAPATTVSKYFDDEGFGVTLHSKRGVISMAHRGKKENTNASQFFILYSPQPSFDGVYTAFGEAVGETSKATLDRLEARGHAAASALPKILSCEVTFNPFSTGEVRFDPSRV